MKKPRAGHIIFTTPRYHSSAELFDQFKQNAMEVRYNTTYQLMKDFIDEYNLGRIVSVNQVILSTAILDYFEDISRLKKFHEMDQANSIKSYAYLVFWILRRKPLQVIDMSDIMEMGDEAEKLSAQIRALSNINERFILQFLCNYLSTTDTSKGRVIGNGKIGINSFVEMLLYYITYRHFDPQSLEMIIFAFCAGQIYENMEQDISGLFHPYDWK